MAFTCFPIWTKINFLVEDPWLYNSRMKTFCFSRFVVSSRVPKYESYLTIPLPHTLWKKVQCCTLLHGCMHSVDNNFVVHSKGPRCRRICRFGYFKGVWNFNEYCWKDFPRYRIYTYNFPNITCFNNSCFSFTSPVEPHAVADHFIDISQKLRYFKGSRSTFLC